MFLLLAGNLKVGQPMLCCFFFKLNPDLQHLLLYMCASFLKYIF